MLLNSTPNYRAYKAEAPTIQMFVPLSPVRHSPSTKVSVEIRFAPDPAQRTGRVSSISPWAGLIKHDVGLVCSYRAKR